MYNIYSIGTISANDHCTTVSLRSQYRKALKYLDRFSHIHIIYIVDNNDKVQLMSIIARVISVDMEDCSVIVEPVGNDLQEGILIDIKPYFPCEDSVKTDHVISNELRYLKADKLDEDSYKLNSAGTIFNRSGEIYIQFNEMPVITSPYIKVLWWFSKFDSNMYRRTVECDPPYENAPRSGIFATRSPVRPNPIAMTVVRVIKADIDARRVYVDLNECFDNTPCLGVWNYGLNKDYVSNVQVPEWLDHWPEWKTETSNYSDIDIDANSELSAILEANKQSCDDDKKELLRSTDEERNQDHLFIKGARVNNLKGINIKIPYGKITAVVGVSGSGKSSLVKDTVYAECRRRMGYLNSERNLLQKPDMEYMTGAIPAVMISQKEITAGSQSTVGTYSDAYDYLRIIYSVVGVRHCPHCGNEIIPLKEDTIIELLSRIDNAVICDLDKVPINGKSLDKKIEFALQAGKGAFYACIDNKYVLFQTRDKCYRCDRIMFSLTPASFSYTNPESRCSLCSGKGTVMELDESLLIERPELSLLDGASSFWGRLRNFIASPNANWMKGQVIALANRMNIDLQLPWKKLPENYRRALIDGIDETVTFTYDNKKNGRRGEITRPVEGVRQIVRRLYDGSRNMDSITRYMKEQKCSCCQGERLNQEGRNVTIGRMRYPEVAAMSFTDISVLCKHLPEILGHIRYSQVRSYVIRLNELADAAIRLGIGYLELNRVTDTLSGGESQRLKLLTTIQNKMTGILYVLDEPSKGLHPDDYGRIAGMMKELVRNGNTVLMVEHNEDMIKIADNIIEIGPGAGENGGCLIGEGSLEAMINNNGTQTGRYLCSQYSKNRHKIINKDFIELSGLNSNNLKNIDIRFPKNALTCICGVSGSGKSTLMKKEIYARMNSSNEFREVILMDQKPVGKTSRSVIATYMEVMDLIRNQFASTDEATELGLDDNVFSFNSEKGQCSVCKGEGRLKLPYTEDDTITCPECCGRRYKKNILNIRYKNKNIADVLDMTIEEACEYWSSNSEISRILNVIREVGLEYLKLGQSITTLSGGEASRIKLAKRLIKGKNSNTLFLFDEPTTGLHFSDIDKLTVLIRKIIDQGNTVIAIEHNRQFLEERDWMICLGPGAGQMGGTIIKMDN